MKKTITIASLIATAGFAGAATSYIDFASPNGSSAGAADGNGNFWNDLNSGTTLTNMVDSSNAATSWDFTLSSSVNYGGGAFNSGTPAPSPFDLDTAYGDGLFVNVSDPAITLAFSDLAANTQYDFSITGGRDNGDFDNGIVAVTTGTGTGGTLLEDQILTFSITSDGSGNAAFSYTWGNTGGGSNSTLTAMSITQVPEPSSAALLGLGGLALMLRRRK